MATFASRGVTSGRAGGDVASGRGQGTGNNDVSQREDLANFISMITRDETPFMSSIGKTKATAIYHEWQTDTLQPPGNSRISEGVDFVQPGATQSIYNQAGDDNQTTGSDFAIAGPFRSRLGNYAQINGKTIAVSGTRRAIDQAGVADEYAYQLKKRGTEMRRDVEYDLVATANVASLGSSSPHVASDARQMGTYRAWINGATVVNAANVTGTDNGTLPTAANSGEGSFSYNSTTAGTNGTPATRANRRPLTLADIDSVMQSIYEEGGKATKVMVSPKLRRDFSDLMINDSGVRRNIDEGGKLRQSVDVYMSDFGDLMVVPNYIMGMGSGDTGFADEAAFIYDPQWFAMATLRPMQEVEVGQKGDSTIGMFVEEQTFEVKNPVGCGAIYGLI